MIDKRLTYPLACRFQKINTVKVDNDPPPSKISTPFQYEIPFSGTLEIMIQRKYCEL